MRRLITKWTVRWATLGPTYKTVSSITNMLGCVYMPNIIINQSSQLRLNQNGTLLGSLHLVVSRKCMLNIAIIMIMFIYRGMGAELTKCVLYILWDTLTLISVFISLFFFFKIHICLFFQQYKKLNFSTPYYVFLCFKTNNIQSSGNRISPAVVCHMHCTFSNSSYIIWGLKSRGASPISLTTQNKWIFFTISI